MRTLTDDEVVRSFGGYSDSMLLFFMEDPDRYPSLFKNAERLMNMRKAVGTWNPPAQEPIPVASLSGAVRLVAWMAKYYMQTAKQVSADNALDHAILKWSGLEPDVLRRYGLAKCGNIILADDDESSATKLYITSETCALCYHHIKAAAPTYVQCGNCPLFKVRGYPCDEHDITLGAWSLWHTSGSPKAMLTLLRDAKQLSIEEPSVTITMKKNKKGKPL